MVQFLHGLPKLDGRMCHSEWNLYYKSTSLALHMSMNTEGEGKQVSHFALDFFVFFSLQQPLANFPFKIPGPVDFRQLCPLTHRCIWFLNTDSM